MSFIERVLFRKNHSSNPEFVAETLKVLQMFLQTPDISGPLPLFTLEERVAIEKLAIGVSDRIYMAGIPEHDELVVFSSEYVSAIKNALSHGKKLRVAVHGEQRNAVINHFGTDGIILPDSWKNGGFRLYVGSYGFLTRQWYVDKNGEMHHYNTGSVRERLFPPGGIGDYIPPEKKQADNQRFLEWAHDTCRTMDRGKPPNYLYMPDTWKV